MFEACSKNQELDRAQTRKEQVLDAAADCFIRRGFHGASMAEVAKAANMSVGHIYHYFENKEAIIASIVDRGLKELTTMMEGLRCQQDVLQAVLDQADRNILQNADHKHAVLAVEVLAEATRNPKVAQFIVAADEVARGKLRELIASTHGSLLESAELDARVDLAAALFDGLKMRVWRNPNFDREAMMPLLRSMLQIVFS